MKKCNAMQEMSRILSYSCLWLRSRQIYCKHELQNKERNTWPPGLAYARTFSDMRFQSLTQKSSQVQLKTLPNNNQRQHCDSVTQTTSTFYFNVNCTPVKCLLVMRYLLTKADDSPPSRVSHPSQRTQDGSCICDKKLIYLVVFSVSWCLQ